MSGWIGVDLDGTLAVWDGTRGLPEIGEPVPAMLERVKKWLADGIEVRIFTARMAAHGHRDIFGNVVDIVTPIEEWCLKHVGRKLKVTNTKDFGTREIWDDIAVGVWPNTGIAMTQSEFGLRTKMYALARRLKTYVSEDQILDIADELEDLSGICPDCNGNGVDGDPPDAAGVGGGVWTCERCRGGGITK